MNVQHRPEGCQLPRWRLTLARTGEALEVEAATLPEALRQAGRPDACHLEPAEGGRLSATFHAAGLQTIDTHCRQATPAERQAWALALVVDHLERQPATRRDTAEEGHQ